MFRCAPPPAVFDLPQVTFMQGVAFISNEAGTSGGDDAGNGGAVAVGPDGSVSFLGFSEFTDNKAHGGGNGGGLANYGYVYFERRSAFYFNVANGKLFLSLVCSLRVWHTAYPAAYQILVFIFIFTGNGGRNGSAPAASTGRASLRRSRGHYGRLGHVPKD